MTEQIKEEIRIKAKEKEAQRIQIYYKGAEKTKSKNKLPINQQFSFLNLLNHYIKKGLIKIEKIYI